MAPRSLDPSRHVTSTLATSRGRINGRMSLHAAALVHSAISICSLSRTRGKFAPSKGMHRSRRLLRVLRQVVRLDVETWNVNRQ
jgi:hypothetical protein